MIKLPIKFFPLSKSTPTFPPTLLSTCANKVVGHCINGTPLKYVEATKPPRSPITPPPKVKIKSLLVNLKFNSSS